VPGIVQTLSDHQTRPPPVLGVVVNLPYLNPSSVALYARFLASERAALPMIDRLDDCDFVLVRTGLDRADWVASVEREVERLIRSNPDRFVRAAGFPIPLDSAEAV